MLPYFEAGKPLKLMVVRVERQRLKGELEAHMYGYLKELGYTGE